VAGALRGVLRFATVHSLDIDARANAIAVGIADRSEEAAIRSFVGAAGVPIEAVVLEVGPAAAPL
jgi:hypothetical protein